MLSRLCPGLSPGFDGDIPETKKTEVTILSTNFWIPDIENTVLENSYPRENLLAAEDRIM